MRQTLTISLPEHMSNEINNFLNQENITRSEFIREAINDYIYHKKLKKLRDKMLIHAQKNNIFTDEDVFNVVS